MQPHLVGHEPVAGQPGPAQGILSLLDPLLSSASAIVEVYHTFRLGRQVALLSLDDSSPIDSIGEISTVNITRAKQDSFTIPEVIEAEQWMKTGTPEMSVAS